MSDLEQTIQEAKKIAQSPEGKKLASRYSRWGAHLFRMRCNPQLPEIPPMPSIF